MEKFIEVYDDMIPSELADNLENLLLGQSIPWAYIQNITKGSSSNAYLPGFSYYFINNNTNIYTPFCFNIFQILYNLTHNLNIDLLDIIQARAFLQIPSLKSSPNEIHTDLEFPHWVCLYYVCDSDGDTILFDDNGNEIQRVTPKKGRIVFFDGLIKHCSSSPTKTHRAVVNFDFIGKKL